MIYLQEPGPFQSICRLFYKSNKTDLQFMYNPIQIACSSFLTKEGIEKHPRIKILFSCAQNGLRKLMETYKNCSIISLCLNYYYAIITNHIDQIKNDKIFYKDNLSNFYSSELTNSLNEQWTEDKKKVILDLITFLTGDNMANNNVKSLETIMENNDLNTQHIILHF